jgi:hypothetical protein
LKQPAAVSGCGTDICRFHAAEVLAGGQQGERNFGSAVFFDCLDYFDSIQKFQAAEHTLPAFVYIFIACLKEKSAARM